ncbi:hypothetical protein [Neobacillus sp. Marseille-QA0830]
MEKIRLSMPVAFLIENCLTSGLPIETIIDSLKNHQFSFIKEMVQDKDMDFQERFQTAEELGEKWEAAIRDGYELKWLHMNGLKKLLRYRFKKIAELDYVQDGLVISSLTLENPEYQLLSSMICRQWMILSETDRSSDPSNQYRIELKIS